MSSSAFFIEAAAKTVMVLSCAAAGEGAAAEQDEEGGKNADGETMHGGAPVHACGALIARADQALVELRCDEAEAPFRHSRRLTVIGISLSGQYQAGGRVKASTAIAGASRRSRRLRGRH